MARRNWEGRRKADLVRATARHERDWAAHVAEQSDEHRAPRISKQRQREWLAHKVADYQGEVRRPALYAWTPWREVTDGERYTVVRLGGVMWERNGVRRG